MAQESSTGRTWAALMTVGAYEGEPEAQAGKRRILVGYAIIGFLPRLFFGAIGISEGFAAVGSIDIAAAFVPVIAIVALHYQPQWYTQVVYVVLAALIVENLIPTVMFGGLLEADLLMAFTVLVVIGALITLRRRAAFWWFVAFIGGLVLAVVLPESIDPIYDVEPATAFDVAGVLGSTAAFMYAGMAYFVRQRDRFQQQSDDLLHNTLPAVIVSELKERGEVAARRIESASVLFADIVGFTHMSEEMGPEEMVARLNEVFTLFDSLTARHGCEKIRTIGDNYMVACGVPTPRDDHAAVLTEMGLEMLDYATTSPFSFRIGINSGPLVAGVVGTSKFQYDVWGDTVNTASRMESHGEPGRLQIGKSTHELIRDEFVCAFRGPIDVKGKGQLETWFVEGPLETG